MGRIFNEGCRKDQFVALTFYLKICTDPGLQKIRHSSLVCRCGFAVIIVIDFPTLFENPVFRNLQIVLLALL